jgi:HEAT repeat protein
MNTNCSDVKTLLIDYADGLLVPAVREKVDQHLKECESCRQEVSEYRILFAEMASTSLQQPPASLKENFNTMLQSELNIAATMQMVNEKKEAKVITVKPMSFLLRIAACLVLVAIGAFGAIQWKSPRQQMAIAEVNELKTEVQQIKETMLLNLLSEESASDRIRAVSYAEELTNPDPKIIQALLTTMNSDDNVNVRMAAINSLAKFTGTNPTLVDSLIASLRSQKEPLVQIVLITVLTDKKETRAIQPLREIISDRETLLPVKQLAEQGLKKVI